MKTETLRGETFVDVMIMFISVHASYTPDRERERERERERDLHKYEEADN